MKIDTYMCTNCYEPKIFKPNDTNPHICEKCGKEMEFWCTEEIDSSNGKVINRGTNNDEHIDVKKIVTGMPTITCPYCQSTNTKKIGIVSRSTSFGLFGFGSSKVGKQWHCNNCKSDF